MKRLRRKVSSLWIGVALSAFCGLIATPLARAAANDDFDNALIVSTLPFSDSVDNATTSIEFGEPQYCAYSPMTVWYAFTPATDMVVRADMSGSSIYDTNINIYRSLGPGFEGLSFLNCATYADTSATFVAAAGETYYLQAGSLGGIGNLAINLQEVAPPVNDNFFSATPIGPLPFNESTDTSGASLQPDEPTPLCSAGALQGSVWYAFTPAASGPVAISLNAWFNPLVAVYTGTTLTDLTEVGCLAGGGLFSFQAYAGVVYYLQFGNLYGPGGYLQFTLDTTPPPVASFFFQPFDPSVYDPVQFYNNSYDPGQSGFAQELWDFGDGTTAAGCCPTHQYAADGDYPVTLDLTTFDGRTASMTQTVPVRTHDVAIVKFSAPQAARSGQTRQITVGLASKLYPENVQIQLLKSVPGASGGFESVGMLTQFVPVRPGNRTTDFSFSYTFTPADAVIGKLTFKAVALVVGGRDALPADNEAVASPTKVAP